MPCRSCVFKEHWQTHLWCTQSQHSKEKVSMKHNEAPIIFSNFHLTKVQFYNGVFRSVFATQDTILSRNNVTEVMLHDCSPKPASLCLEGPALVMSSSCMDYGSYLKMKTPVQFSSVAQLYSTWDFMDCSMPGFPVHHQLTDLQSSSVTLLCPTLCDPVDCSMPGLPVHHQLPEFTQTHVYQVSDAIQPSYPVIPFSSCLKSFPASFTMSLFPGSFPVSQFFASGGQSIGVSAWALVLPMKSQDWFPLEWTGWISLQAKGLSRVFSNTTVQKHQFFSTQLSL